MEVIAINTQELQKLLTRFPKKALCNYTTPIQRLTNYEIHLNKKDIFIKRDDLNGLGAGGNKVRSLEYLLGDAINSNSNLIITSGQKESNLCCLTAVACSKTGLPCFLVHNNKKYKNESGNMLLNDIIGVKRVFIGDVTEKDRDSYVQKLASECRCKGFRPYVIENGGSTAIGALGYVNACLELVDQQKQYPFKNLCVCGGNGGTAAGLIFGSAFLDIPFRIHVITVEHLKGDLQNRIGKIINDLETITGWSMPYNLDEIMTIHDEYRGEGWGKPTKESNNMIHEFARKEGIFLEKVYLSKTFYGMMSLIRNQKLQGGVCGIHTGGFPSIFSQFIDTSI